MTVSAQAAYEWCKSFNGEERINVIDTEFLYELWSEFLITPVTKGE